MKDMEAIHYGLFMSQVNNKLTEAITSARYGSSIFTEALNGNRKSNTS